MPNPLKLQKIKIQNFRGFPGPQVYEFNLGSKNLLLYGENGSGKSTLFHAIREFFDLERRSLSFTDQKNLFSPDPGGEIALTFSDNANSVVWSTLANRPFGDARVAQTALRTACLDYRAILRTSFMHLGNEVDLFDILVKHLLANYPVTITGGVTRTLYSVWDSVQKSVPKRNTKPNLAKIDERCDQFNAILQQEIPRLEKEAEKLLQFFPECCIALHLKPVKISYNKDTHRLENQKILLEVDFNNIPIPGHQHFLNEARLSGIALALYLASAKLSIPADLDGAPESLKLLVLDDVVIGLDLSNRLPLLDILQNEFSTWQILLMTYDKVWFEMVHERNPGWKIEELYIDVSTYPVRRDITDYLAKSEEHFGNNDYNAAAVYIRAEFERRLKNICHKKNVAITYKKRQEDFNKSENLLNGLELFLKTDPNWTNTYEPMINRIRAARKVVMNPLSHSQLISLAHNEIQDAIDAVKNLQVP